jgi:hypothetical protein
MQQLFFIHITISLLAGDAPHRRRPHRHHPRVHAATPMLAAARSSSLAVANQCSAVPFSQSQWSAPGGRSWASACRGWRTRWDGMVYESAQCDGFPPPTRRIHSAASRVQVMRIADWVLHMQIASPGRARIVAGLPRGKPAPPHLICSHLLGIIS